MNKYETHEQVRGKLARPKFYISFPDNPEENPTYYFDAETGAAVTNQFVYADGHWYYFGKDGKALLFDQVVNGQHLYFDANGRQVKGGFVMNTDGSRSFYHWNTGDKLVSTFFTTGHDRWYYADDKGNVVTGAQVINGQKLFFATDGKQVKVTLQQMRMAVVHTTMELLVISQSQPSSLLETTTGIMLMPKVDLLLANRRSTAKTFNFDQTGKQVKGATAANPDGSISYYDVHTGEKAINRWVKIPSGQWVYFNAQGKGYVSN